LKLVSQILELATLTTAIALATAISFVSGIRKEIDWQTSIFGESGDRDVLKIILYTATLLLILKLETLRVRNQESKFPTRYRRSKFMGGHKALQITLLAILVFLPYLAGKFFGDTTRVQLYKFFAVGALEEEFADLRTTLYAISCPSVNEIGDYIECGNRGNVWLYSTILLKLRILGANSSWTETIGLIFLLITFASLVNLHNKFSTLPRFLLIVLVASPGFQLMLERGNLELIVFSFIALALQVDLKKKFGILTVFLLLSSASLLKFYSVASLTFFILFYLFTSKSLKGKFVLTVACLLILATLIPDSMKSRSYGVVDLSGAFGLPNLLALISAGEDTRVVSLGFSLPIVIIFSLVCFRVTRRALPLLDPSDLDSHLRLVLIAAPLLLTWSTTSNYFYRTGLLMIFILALSEILESKPPDGKNEISFGLVLVFAFSMFLYPRFLAIPLNICLLALNIFGIQVILRFMKALLEQTFNLRALPKNR